MNFLTIQESHGKWFGEAEFQVEKMMIQGKTCARVRDALGDKITSMVKAMDMYTGKKKKGPWKVSDERRREKNREKLIKKLTREGY